MQLPKYKKKKRIKLKICQYCGKEFWGHPIAKYCELHRDVKQREKTKKSPEPGDSNNKTYSHDLIEVVEESWICELDGCGKTYVVKVFPKQYVYPRFCEEHRNEFRRRNYTRQKLIEDIRKTRAAAAKAAAPKVAASSVKVAAKPAAKPATPAAKVAPAKVAKEAVKDVKPKPAKKISGTKA